MFTPLTTVLFWACLLCLALAFHAGIRAQMMTARPLRRVDGLLGTLPGWCAMAALAAVVVYGLWMRLYLYPNLPAGVNQDGAMGATDAMALVRHGTDRLGTPWPAHLEAWGKGQMSALLTYLQAGCFALFGVSRLTMRLPLMVFSLLSLVVFWDFARRMLGKRYGWLALVLLLINPWHIIQSRWAIDCALFPHLFLFGCYCLLRGYSRSGWYYGAMVCFALAMYSYGIALYTVPFFLLAAVVVLLCLRRIRWWEALVCAALYGFIALPFFATMWLNYTGGDNYTLFGLTIQYFRQSQRSAEIVLMRPDWFEGFARNAQSLLNVLLFNVDGFIYLSLPESGAAYHFAIPLIVVGIACGFADRITKKVPWLTPQPPQAEKAGKEQDPTAQTRWGLLLVLLWLLAAAWACLITDQVHLGRAAILMYPVILLIAYAIFRVGKAQKWLAALLVVIHLAGAAQFGFQYFAPQTQHTMGRYFYAGLVEALEASRGRDMETLYVTQMLPAENQYGIPEEVLIEYAHQLDPLYVQGMDYPVDAHGRQWYSFSERYMLMDISDMYIDPNEEALYLIYEDERPLFAPADFTFEEFGDYILVTPNVLRK